MISDQAQVTIYLGGDENFKDVLSFHLENDFIDAGTYGRVYRAKSMARQG